MTEMQKINEAHDFINKKIAPKDELIGVVLGTGLGALVDEIKIELEINYADIPHFPVSTVESHSGKLIFGTLAGKPVVAMQGRFHYYEGYSMKEITFPIRVMHLLGVKSLLISNACGGMNPQFAKGDILVITDHINLLGDNPLIGANLDDFGPRFPDMSEPYTKRLIDLAESEALSLGFSLRRGVYVAVAGPCLETRAEYRFLKQIGADVVGMSTVPEVIVAVHQGMRVLGLSVITDECFPDSLVEANVEDIIATAMAAQPRLTAVMKQVISKLDYTN
jgi:purine-nucleoside phosphorylase